jgi:hypothetical protein
VTAPQGIRPDGRQDVAPEGLRMRSVRVRLVPRVLLLLSRALTCRHLAERLRRSGRVHPQPTKLRQPRKAGPNECRLVLGRPRRRFALWTACPPRPGHWTTAVRTLPGHPRVTLWACRRPNRPAGGRAVAAGERRRHRPATRSFAVEQSGDVLCHATDRRPPHGDRLGSSGYDEPGVQEILTQDNVAESTTGPRPVSRGTGPLCHKASLNVTWEAA